MADSNFDFSKVHIYIALPCYGGQIFEVCFMSILKFIVAANHYGMKWTIDTMVNESLIPRGRNNLASKFLANTDATHMMFIDADIRFDPEYIFKMLAADKELIAGLYPMKCIPPKFVINGVPNASIEGPLEEVLTAGTGFMLIKREVFTELIKAYPETKYVDDIGIGKQYEPFMYALFDGWINPENHHYYSEDWTFCHRWRALGKKVWVHKEVILDHSGYYSFRGQDAVKELIEQSQKMASAAANTAQQPSPVQQPAATIPQPVMPSPQSATPFNNDVKIGSILKRNG